MITKPPADTIVDLFGGIVVGLIAVKFGWWILIILLITNGHKKEKY